ncbi:BlaI/MecI/CopY family transcriptional regulator [Elongatibacter sediminis]|uniref:BlaI/MecI/CopY family transcriptional regulator n=1 Tax=Elongatibacter sediminis TaxID=3119006 RepID=A0AAW9RD35_9GAMM
MDTETGGVPQPTRTELTILNILWDRGPSTVREVHESLNRIEKSGYTTALKMLQVMHQKRQVVRDDSERAHVYSAAISKDETQKLFLSDLADRLFDGSTSRLVLQALGSSQRASSEEIEHIRQLLQRLEDD